MVEAVIADNPDQVAQYLEADEAKQKKLSGFFVGQIMKASKGQANPQMVNELLLKKLNDQS
jgi:aspartyl-tRNA(Asn)/glutamyl-tRNA(Gln) amidotransferase subunit B